MIASSPGEPADFLGVRPASGPHVAVVVLAHNGCEHTLACLASLQQVRWPILTVIVVDNGSLDGTYEAVHSRFPSACVLRLENNLGFAEGNNVGIRHAVDLGADFVFLLNNDTTIAPDAIAVCVDVATKYHDAGAVCPLIYFANQPDLIWYAGAAFDPSRAYSGQMLGYRERDRGQFEAVRETGRAVGAAVLLPTSVLQQVGLLSSELFFLYEDIDWSLRARRSGRQIYLAPAARVWHLVSATAGGEHSPTIAYYDTRNHIVVCERHAPLYGMRRLRRELGILAVHLAGARRATRRAAYVRGVLAGFADARRGRLGRRP